MAARQTADVSSITNHNGAVNSGLQNAVALAQDLGQPSEDLVILAEGNVSAREDDDTFWVKASGFSMRNIGADGFIQVKFAPIQNALQGGLADGDVKELLSTCRFNPVGNLRPSVETFMHAYLLSLPGVEIVGHTHPTALLSLLSLTTAPSFARKRLFPDEVVCCGPAACFVPYVDPGLPLALAIRDSVQYYVEEFGSIPKTIWLQNHGLIALGASAAEVKSATKMSVKSARVWLQSLATGQDLSLLSAEQIERIHTRPDEHYRQRLLWGLGLTEPFPLLDG